MITGCFHNRREDGRGGQSAFTRAEEKEQEKRRKFYKTGYWQKIRQNQLRKSPFCENCLAGFGKNPHKTFTLANTCDHIDPTWTTWQDFCRGPFQSLCHSCHSTKTTTEDLPKKKRKKLLTLQVSDV